ncbi:Clp protease N-terminal domain-containing protein [Actinomadura macra]|uniref:Clp protease N-terminal domain-containing protein n=1 Tax=Actinomadura macra TaxID=46164 RepID=UPI0008367DD4|nr:Clp protease N-terminal domain-containing protein [Actinomadura macra]
MRPFGGYVQTIMERGAQEARRDGSATIEAEHLLLAIAAEDESSTRELLASAGLDHEAIRDALEREFRHSLSAAGVTVAGGTLPRSSKAANRPTRLGASARLVVERGVAAAASKRDLRPAHLLLGVLRLKVGTVPRALALAGVDQSELATRVQRSLPGAERAAKDER